MILVVAIGFAGVALGGEKMTLKDAFDGKFYVGAALGRGLFKEPGQPTLELVARQFNTVTPESCMKWEPFNPEPGQFNYEAADEFVAFGKKHDMYVVGHVFFWNNQTPDWVYKDADGKQLTREALLQRMRERVRSIAERYKGEFHAWDVVNEMYNRGWLRRINWIGIIGDDFIEQAFRIADAELPKDVELIYNDFSMTDPRKRDAVVKMVRDLKQKGVRIDGVGMQGHWSIDSPRIEEIEASIVAFAEAGVDVHITELDIDVLPRHPKMRSGDADVKLKLQDDPTLNPYTEGLPEDMQEKLAQRYQDIFGLFLKHHDKIKRVTFWGTTDKHSWLNGWPIKGRTNYPLLFDRDGKPKPAYHAVLELVKHDNQPGPANAASHSETDRNVSAQGLPNTD